MKAITLWQPWASLVAWGKKRIETRSWATNYRGPIAIHAATRRIDMETQATLLHMDSFVHAVPDVRFCSDIDLYPYGKIVATAFLVECVRIPDPQHSINYNYHMSYIPVYRNDRLVSWQPMYPEYIFIPPTPQEPEHYFGDYTPGRFAWILSNIRSLAIPKPAKGAQGIWEWQK